MAKEKQSTVPNKFCYPALYEQDRHRIDPIVAKYFPAAQERGFQDKLHNGLDNVFNSAKKRADKENMKEFLASAKFGIVDQMFAIDPDLNLGVEPWRDAIKLAPSDSLARILSMVYDRVLDFNIKEYGVYPALIKEVFTRLADNGEVKLLCKLVGGSEDGCPDKTTDEARANLRKLITPEDIREDKDHILKAYASVTALNQALVSIQDPEEQVEFILSCPRNTFWDGDGKQYLAAAFAMDKANQTGSCHHNNHVFELIDRLQPSSWHRGGYDVLLNHLSKVHETNLSNWLKDISDEGLNWEIRRYVLQTYPMETLADNVFRSSLKLEPTPEVPASKVFEGLMNFVRLKEKVGCKLFSAPALDRLFELIEKYDPKTDATEIDKLQKHAVRMFQIVSPKLVANYLIKLTPEMRAVAIDDRDVHNQSEGRSRRSWPC